jgi:hypothetical protein
MVRPKRRSVLRALQSVHSGPLKRQDLILRQRLLLQRLRPPSSLLVAKICRRASQQALRQ